MVPVSYFYDDFPSTMSRLCQRHQTRCWLFFGRKKCQSYRHNWTWSLLISAVYILLRNHRELITKYKKKNCFFCFENFFHVFMGAEVYYISLFVTPVIHTFLSFFKLERIRKKNDKTNKFGEKNHCFCVEKLFFFFFFLIFFSIWKN